MKHNIPKTPEGPCTKLFGPVRHFFSLKSRHVPFCKSNFLRPDFQTPKNPAHYITCTAKLIFSGEMVSLYLVCPIFRRSCPVFVFSNINLRL